MIVDRCRSLLVYFWLCKAAQSKGKYHFVNTIRNHNAKAPDIEHHVRMEVSHVYKTFRAYFRSTANQTSGSIAFSCISVLIVFSEGEVDLLKEETNVH